MLTDLEDPPAPPQLWSWKKILAGSLGLLTVFITALLAYDEKLEPCDDLKPTRTEIPDARTNGYLMLKAAWEKQPVVDSAFTRKWTDIESGLLPWDEELVPKLNPSRRDLRKDLSQALAAPAWQVPFSRIMPLDEEESAFNPRYGILIMTAEAWQKTRNGNPDSTVGLIGDLRRFSLRQIKGSNRASDLITAWYPNGCAGEITARLLAEPSPPEAILTHLTSCWAEDQWTQADMAGPIAGESQYLTGYFQNGIHKKDDAFGGDHLGRRLLVMALTKPNMVQNRINRVLRTLRTSGMATSTTKNDSVVEELERLAPSNPKGLDWLNANLAGSQMTRQFLAGPVFYISYYSRLYVFQERATRISIAMKRWQLNHPGAIPASLDELVPEYLAAVPPDPYDGRPIRWDPATQVIYATGSDWNPDIPTFYPRQRSWFNLNHESPGLRLVMPPPPPPPPPSPKKPAKPAAKSSSVPATTQ